MAYGIGSPSLDARRHLTLLLKDSYDDGGVDGVGADVSPPRYSATERCGASVDVNLEAWRQVSEESLGAESLGAVSLQVTKQVGEVSPQAPLGIYFVGNSCDVRGVQPGSPAAQAGIRAGMCVAAVAGSTVTSADAVWQKMEDAQNIFTLRVSPTETLQWARRIADMLDPQRTPPIQCMEPTGQEQRVRRVIRMLTCATQCGDDGSENEFPLVPRRPRGGTYLDDDDAAVPPDVLIVRAIGCEDLVGQQECCGLGVDCDAFVEIRVDDAGGPASRAGVGRTQVAPHRDLNPSWGECFVFPTAGGPLTIVADVLDYDVSSDPDRLGSAMVRIPDGIVREGGWVLYTLPLYGGKGSAVLPEAQLPLQKPPGAVLGVTFHGRSTRVKEVHTGGALAAGGGSAFIGLTVTAVNGKAVNSSSDIFCVVNPMSDVTLTFAEGRASCGSSLTAAVHAAAAGGDAVGRILLEIGLPGPAGSAKSSPFSGTARLDTSDKMNASDNLTFTPHDTPHTTPRVTERQHESKQRHEPCPPPELGRREAAPYPEDETTESTLSEVVDVDKILGHIFGGEEGLMDDASESMSSSLPSIDSPAPGARRRSSTSGRQAGESPPMHHPAEASALVVEGHAAKVSFASAEASGTPEVPGPFADDEVFVSEVAVEVEDASVASTVSILASLESLPASGESTPPDRGTV